MNVTDADPTIAYVNFTLIAPNGSKVINNLNGSKSSGDLYNTTFNMSSYGTWLWNVSVLDSDGFVVNTTTISIILMEVNLNLNNTLPLRGASVAVSGKINLSNNTDVTNNLVHLFLDDAEQLSWADHQFFRNWQVFWSG